MILPGQTIRALGILDPCVERSTGHGLSRGLGPAGYDLSLDLGDGWLALIGPSRMLRSGDFILAATQERFQMPADLLGIVHDKSSLARRGVSVFNTVIEPGWRGYLTLEIVNHGPQPVVLHQGMGIAQVIFHRLESPAERPYDGKYQDQEPGPQGARS